MKMSNERRVNGFTLIELLVVITILSILSVITFSQFQTAQRKARDSQRKTDMVNLEKALNMYIADHGVYPEASSYEGGKIVINGVTLDWGEEFKEGNVLYMKQLPKEKFNESTPYCYVTSEDKKMMGVYSILENDGDKDYNKENSGDNYSCGQRGVYNYIVLSPNASYLELPHDAVSVPNSPTPIGAGKGSGDGIDPPSEL